jgi:hypothetical protein
MSISVLQRSPNVLQSELSVSVLQPAVGARGSGTRGLRSTSLPPQRHKEKSRTGAIHRPFDRPEKSEERKHI